MKKKVVLGLSGGVDSAVAARLLLREYEVYCLYLDIGLGGTGGADAAAVAASLGLPFEVADIRDELEREVCTPFAADYLAGRTPLPCARCNPAVKFPSLLALADKVGAELVATGHYAQVRDGVLYKGRPANDQSYMLAQLPKDILQRVLFPLGDYEKTEIRALAHQFGISVADKPDSMEICFIPDGDYATWLDCRGDTPPAGNFVAPDGTVLGRHKGIHHYTLGQRRGLGVSSTEGRLFVSEIRTGENVVVLTNGTDLFVQTARCGGLNWIGVAGLDGTLEVTVRLRHSHYETPAVLTPARDGTVDIAMAEPARAPTPGQLAVFYQGDAVVGSGWIV